MAAGSVALKDIPAVPGLNPVFGVEVSWVDAEGSRQVKISHISL